MRLGRIASPNGVAFVSIEPAPVPEGAAAQSSVAQAVGAGEAPEPQLICREIAEHPFGTPTFTGRSWPLADVRLLAPILATKIVAIGKNYAAHAAELGGEAPENPVIFMKPNTAIVGPEAPIILPPASHRVDHEGELAVVIGRPCKDVKAADARSVILGYTIANDVTARDIQQADGQWTRAKSYDTFCPLGPWIETELDPSDVDITTTLDGEIKQDSNTALLLHTVGEIIEWVSAVMTLLPGDVILTGTPEGVGPMKAGQTVEVSISGIGTLRNPVAARR
jgi:2-keto-4-pentenoate hydratase/2-oxohepta-3-ene-1,7-dioic acid hydratase in catechol pathway